MGSGGKRPFSAEQEAQLIAGIREAERGNRGEVRVHVEARCPGGDALLRSRALYERLGMRATRDDTAVLLYVARDDRKAAVFAGAGIHGAAQAGFWQEVVDTVSAGFKAGDGIGGLVAALVKTGDLLREHAPGEDDAGNELPDAVTTS